MTKILLLLVVIIALAIPASASAVTEIWCAPPSGGYVCTGTDGADLIHGTSGADVIAGKGGNDEIHGLAGADTIHGNGGADDIFGGGAGSATGLGNNLYGNRGNDLLDMWQDTTGCPWGLFDGGDGSDVGRGWQFSGHQSYMPDVESPVWKSCP